MPIDGRHFRKRSVKVQQFYEKKIWFHGNDVHKKPSWSDITALLADIKVCPSSVCQTATFSDDLCNPCVCCTARFWPPSHQVGQKRRGGEENGIWRWFLSCQVPHTPAAVWRQRRLDVHCLQLRGVQLPRGGEGQAGGAAGAGPQDKGQQIILIIISPIKVEELEAGFGFIHLMMAPLRRCSNI